MHLPPRPAPPHPSTQVYPSNAAELANNNSRLHVWASNVDPTASTILPPSPLAHDLYPYTSKLDVADAVIASSYVPCNLGPQPAGLFRGRGWIDGGASTSMDDVCASLKAMGEQCAKVIALQVGPGSPNPSNAGCPPPDAPTTPRTGPLYPLLPVANWTLPLNCTAYPAYSDFQLVFPPVTAETICAGWCEGGRGGQSLIVFSLSRKAHSRARVTRPCQQN